MNILGMKKSNETTNLRKLNLIAAVLHAAQGFAVLVLSKTFTIPVSGAFLRFDTQSETLQPASSELFGLSLPALIATFFFLSSFFHLFIASVYRKSYEAGLKNGINRARWWEYSLSASVMIVAIASLVGIYDLSTLLMMFVLTSVMNLMGLVMEVHNQTTKKTNWLSYNIGTYAGIVPWLVIAFTMWLGADQGSKAPTFVYWIFVSIFLFFSCFALNMILQYKKIGKWSSYIYGERTYIILSLVAKTLLAWQVFAGTLRP